MSGGQDCMIFPCMALRRTDIANTTMTMTEVVPTHEARRPDACFVDVGKALGGELGPVLGRAKQRLGVGVVVAHARPGVRGLDAQPFEHRQDRRRLERGAVVAVQHRLGAERRNALSERGAGHQMRGMVGVVGLVHLPAHDLSAVQIQDQIQVKPTSHHLRGQIAQVPAPHFAHSGGDVRGGRPFRLGRLGAAAVGALPVLAQHAAEGGLAREVNALIGQYGHNARRLSASL